MKKINAILTGQLINIAAGESKEVKFTRVIDFTLEVPSGDNTVYINFSPTGKNKSFPIGAGASRSFSPSADHARYNRPIFLYAESASKVRLFTNQDGGEYDG